METRDKPLEVNCRPGRLMVNETIVSEWNVCPRGQTEGALAKAKSQTLYAGVGRSAAEGDPSPTTRHVVAEVWTLILL